MDHTSSPLPTASAEAALAAALGDLADAGIDSALVRPAARDGLGRLEADVLIRPQDRRRAEAMLASDGFRRRPGWGRRPHRFHHRPVVSAVDGTVEWLKIDLVTVLRFGRHHELPGASATCLLDVRDRDIDRHRLAGSDEFFALLLHGLLDRRELRSDQMARLGDLAAPITDPGTLGSSWGPEEGPAPTWSDLLQAVRSQQWATLDDQRAVLRSRLLRDEPVRVLARSGWNRVARHAAKPLTALCARGPLVAVLGTDGTGKSTLTSSLADASGLPSRVLYGGTYPAGTPRSRVPGFTMMRVLGRLLRTRLSILWHRGRGRLVVLDRHPVQVRPTAESDLARKTRFRRRLLAATLPRPDLTVVLDAPVSVLHQRRPEHASAFLAEDRRRHLALAEREGSTVLDATLEPNELCGRLVGLVWERALEPGPSLMVGRP